MSKSHWLSKLDSDIVLCTIMVRTDNKHAKLSCAPPNQYKAMLCNAKVYVSTDYIVNLDLDVCCQPQKYYTMHWCPCAPPMYVRCQPTRPQTPYKKCPFFACPLWTTKNWNISGATPTSHRHRSPSSVVCNVVPYPWIGAQCSSHNSAQAQLHQSTCNRQLHISSSTIVVLQNGDSR